MACLFADSFDHYAITDITRKWTQIYSGVTSAHAIATGAGRRSTNAFKVTRSTGNDNLNCGGLARVLTPGTTTGYLGFAFQGVAPSGGGWGSLATVGLGGNSLLMSQALSGINDVRVNVLAAIRNSYYTHVALVINNNGTISAYRGHADSLNAFDGQDRIAATYGTTSLALLTGQYYFIELHTLIHPSAGTLLLKVNGDTWLTLSGIDTQADGASSVAAWQEILVGGLRASSGQVDWYVDDLYAGDADASDAFNQMINIVGDVRVDYRNVFQDGTTLQWTPSTGLSHFAMVDDNPPDLDSTYDATTTVGAVDTFLKQGVPIVGAAVIALQPIYLVRRTDGGNTSTAAVIRDGGTNFTGSQEGSGQAIGNTSTYTYDWWTVTQRPSASGTPLTQALVDAMEIGFKKVT